MKRQSQVTHRPLREDCEDVRLQIKRVLRMHKMGATVSLSALAIVAVISASGLFAALLNRLPPPTSFTDDSMLVVVCAGGWLVSLHVLWRCYRSGLDNVRGLLTQLIQLDEGREVFATAHHALKSTRAPSDSKSEASIGRESSPERRLKRRKASVQNPPTLTDGIDNVLKFDNYKNM